jgi:hypothetical protein
MKLLIATILLILLTACKTPRPVKQEDCPICKGQDPTCEFIYQFQTVKQEGM